jgi:TRAP-type C4-dicarboxylate transport system permease large subunit
MVFLIVVVAIFFVVGLFVEGTTAMLIFVPVFTPMVQGFGIDPLQIALIVIVSIMVGTITPPVGLQLYVTAHIAKIPFFKVEIWTFAAIMLAVVLALMLVPEIVTFVPNLVMN